MEQFSFAHLIELFNQLQSGIARATLDYKNAQSNLAKMKAAGDLVGAFLEEAKTQKDTSDLFAPLATTIIPSGQLISEAINHFLQAENPEQRSVFATQIYSATTVGFADFLAAVPSNIQVEFPKLKATVTTNIGAIESLASQLSKRLADTGLTLEKQFQRVQAALKDVEDPGRFSHAGTELRELLRELFAVIAPDTKIEECRWFDLDKALDTKVTRRHRIKFSIFGYLSPENFPEHFLEDVETLAGELIKKIDALSKLTHVTKELIESSELEGASQIASTMQMFLMLFDTIDVAKGHVMDRLEIELADHLSSVFREDFFDDLDILSTHTRPQFAEDISIRIYEIDAESISFAGTGSVHCELQYGSDGDCRRGDGVEWSDSFPFEFSGNTSVESLADVEVEKSSIRIDTSKYWGDEEVDFTAEP